MSNVAFKVWQFLEDNRGHFPDLEAETYDKKLSLNFDASDEAWWKELSENTRRDFEKIIVNPLRNIFYEEGKEK